MSIKNKILSLILAMLMLLSALPIGALAVQDEADPLAYGKVGSSYAVTLKPSALLSLLLGEELSEAEIAYLDRYCDRILEYYDRIPTEDIEQYSRDGSLEVTAARFSYTAENGATVSWIPQEVIYAGRAGVAMEEIREGEDAGKYIAELTEVSKSEPGDTMNRIEIVYACELTIPAEVVNELSAFAYNDAKASDGVMTTAEYTAAYAAARDAYECYQRDMANYADAAARYEEYLRERDEYLTEKDKYDEYVEKKAEYDQKKAAYDQYLLDLAAYNAAKTEYDRVYQEITAANASYSSYLINLNRIDDSMKAMESLFEAPETNVTGTLYKALQNAELVNMFEQNKEILIGYTNFTSGVKVTEKMLTDLRASSDELNALLVGYAAARDRSKEAAFRYYKENYHKIKTLFNDLYSAMYSIIDSSLFNKICFRIESQYKSDPKMATYKKWRIKNVLAHMYLICLALDDNQTANGTFKFYDETKGPFTYQFIDLLDKNLILTDNNCACPDNLSWMPAVPKPEPMPDAPVKPTTVSEPVPPTTVDEPTEPEAVSQPLQPSFVAEPREATPEELAQYALADRAVAIVAALRDGQISERATVSAPMALSLTKNVTCPIAFDNGRLVIVYDADGKIIFSEEKTPGETIFNPNEYFDHEQFAISSDAQYTYTFMGFALDPDADPEQTLPALPNMVEGKDLVFYPIYKKTIRQYWVTIDWGDGSEPTCTEMAYGTVPTLATSLERAPTNEEVFTFAGWDKPAEPVTQDVTYVAQWQTSTRFYTVDWQMPSGETVRQGRETYHATPVVPTVPSMYYEGEGCVRYDFVGWDKQVAPVTEDVIYTAQYRQTVLAEAENEELTLTSALGEYTLTGSGARAAVGGLFDVAKKEKKRVALSFPELSASLDVEAVKSLEQAGVAYTAVLRDTSGGVGVGFYSAEGKAVRASAGLMHISFAYEPMEGATVCSLACDMAGNEFMSSCTPENGTLTLSAAANCTYRAAYQFPLTVQSEGGTVFANGEQYFIGEMPRLTSYPNSQHILSQISLTNNLTGESVILDSLSDFVMPAYPATLSVTFVPQTYRVVFVLNGEIISEAEYLLGDTVVVPQIETAFVEDGYRYTFIGWSSPIGAVTGDATYEAKFFSTPIEEVPENLTGEGQATQAAIKELSLLGVAGVAVLAVLIVLPIVGARIIIKKKKRKKIVDDDQA